MQLVGLGLGRGAELALEGIHAELVLAQRGLTAAEARIEAHEGAMDGLLQRVQGEEAEAGLDGGLDGAGALVMGEQAGEGLDGELVQALALGGEPFLEGALGQREPGEEVAAVEGGDLLERGGPAVGDEALELSDVDVDEGGVEGHGGPVEEEAGAGAGGESLADAGQRVAEVAAGLGVLHVPPEQGRELVAGVGLAEGQRQVGHEGLGLPGGEDERRPGAELGLEAPQERKFYPRRELQCSSRTIRKETAFSMP